MTVATHTYTGKVRFLSAANGFPQAASAGGNGQDVETAARKFPPPTYGGLFGLSDQGQELAVERKQEVGEGRHVLLRFQQQEHGIPVMAGELIVQLDANQSVISVNGEILPAAAFKPGAASEIDLSSPVDAGDGPGHPHRRRGEDDNRAGLLQALINYARTVALQPGAAGRWWAAADRLGLAYGRANSGSGAGTGIGAGPRPDRQHRVALQPGGRRPQP